MNGFWQVIFNCIFSIGFVLGFNQIGTDRSESTESLREVVSFTVQKNNWGQTNSGKEIYEQYCLMCHQPAGNGIMGVTPPLSDTEYVLGDKERLVKLILNGSSEGLTIKGVTYSTPMPGFDSLSDQEIANVATYIRTSFGNTADSVTEMEVAQFRTENQQ